MFIVKAIARTLVTMPFSAPTQLHQGVWRAHTLHPCFYVRYAPECTLPSVRIQYTVIIYTPLIIITDEDNNENANELES